MKRLENKIAIVTGGTKGIGLATVKKMAQEGAIVYACARHPKTFDNPKIIFHELDVVDNGSCKKLYDDIVSKHGRIDILINNAGIMKDRTTKKMSDEEFDSVLNTNVKGTFNMVRIFGPLMQEKKYGSIVNISSFVVKNGNIGQANYIASKLSIEGMTKCWAKEFTIHGENIRVNAVEPGIVLTDIFNSTPKEIIDSFSSKTILKRLASPEEIANAIVFLASDEASYITGTVLDVSGGAIT